MAETLSAEQRAYAICGLDAGSCLHVDIYGTACDERIAAAIRAAEAAAYERAAQVADELADVEDGDAVGVAIRALEQEVSRGG